MFKELKPNRQKYYRYPIVVKLSTLAPWSCQQLQTPAFFIRIEIRCNTLGIAPDAIALKGGNWKLQKVTFNLNH